MKSIPIDAMLSVTTGRMFVEFDELSRTVQWLVGTDQDLATVGVVVLAQEAKDQALKQYPDLPTEMDLPDYRQFLMKWCLKLGNTLPVERGNSGVVSVELITE